MWNEFSKNGTGLGKSSCGKTDVDTLCDQTEVMLSLDWGQSLGSGEIQAEPAHQPSGSASFCT